MPQPSSIDLHRMAKRHWPLPSCSRLLQEYNVSTFWDYWVYHLGNTSPYLHSSDLLFFLKHVCVCVCVCSESVDICGRRGIKEYPLLEPTTSAPRGHQSPFPLAQAERRAAIWLFSVVDSEGLGDSRRHAQEAADTSFASHRASAARRTSVIFAVITCYEIFSAITSLYQDKKTQEGRLPSPSCLSRAA